MKPQMNKNIKRTILGYNIITHFPCLILINFFSMLFFLSVMKAAFTVSALISTSSVNTTNKICCICYKI